MAPFNEVEIPEEDGIWEANFKFSFERVGFGVTLRETSRNNKLTFKSIFLEPREAWTRDTPLCIMSMEVVDDIMTMDAIAQRDTKE